MGDPPKDNTIWGILWCGSDWTKVRMTTSQRSHRSKCHHFVREQPAWGSEGEDWGLRQLYTGFNPRSIWVILWDAVHFMGCKRVIIKRLTKRPLKAPSLECEWSMMINWIQGYSTRFPRKDHWCHLRDVHMWFITNWIAGLTQGPFITFYWMRFIMPKIVKRGLVISHSACIVKRVEDSTFDFWMRKSRRLLPTAVQLGQDVTWVDQKVPGQ